MFITFALLRRALRFAFCRAVSSYEHLSLSFVSTLSRIRYPARKNLEREAYRAYYPAWRRNDLLARSREESSSLTVITAIPTANEGDAQ
jgi:hypothetical protein